MIKTNNNNNTDVIDGLHGLKFCASHEQIEALFKHSIEHRLTPIEFVEKLVAMERHERDARSYMRV